MIQPRGGVASVVLAAGREKAVQFKICAEAPPSLTLYAVLVCVDGPVLARVCVRPSDCRRTQRRPCRTRLGGRAKKSGANIEHCGTTTGLRCPVRSVSCGARGANNGGSRPLLLRPRARSRGDISRAGCRRLETSSRARRGRTKEENG